MTDARESQLPKWAQTLIIGLRNEIKHYRDDENAKQLALGVDRLKTQVQRLTDRNNGLQTLLECAAKGGHVTASDIDELLAGYELVRMKSND